MTGIKCRHRRTDSPRLFFRVVIHSQVSQQQRVGATSPPLPLCSTQSASAPLTDGARCFCLLPGNPHRAPQLFLCVPCLRHGDAPITYFLFVFFVAVDTDAASTAAACRRRPTRMSRNKNFLLAPPAQGRGRQGDRVFLIDYGLACLAGDGEAARAAAASLADAAGASKSKTAAAAVAATTVWVEVGGKDPAAAAPATHASPRAAEVVVGVAPTPVGDAPTHVSSTVEIKIPLRHSSPPPPPPRPPLRPADSEKSDGSSMPLSPALDACESVAVAAAGAEAEAGSNVDDVAAAVAVPTETVKTTSGPTGLVGSVRYLSVAAHAGGRQTRRCDLESLAYVLVYLVRVRVEGCPTPCVGSVKNN